MSKERSSPSDLPSETDRLFQGPGPGRAEFRFDEAVARVFPDMLRRSIPGYSTLLHLIGVLANRTVQEETAVYDLGCSLGAVSLSIRHALGPRHARMIAVDNSPAMVERCRELLGADSGLCPIEVREGDILTMSYEPSSLVVLNFTLQFVPQKERADFLKRISQSLVPGGALVLSEKTRDEDPWTEETHRDLHDAFRQSNGYSQMELGRKRESLERVLVSETKERYEQMLSDAGLIFTPWFQCLHFVSWLAKKPA